ncbi:MAG: hypothetical protein HY650_10445 [Acidobacteria bacterium]|nr:hypothetical protein [Acidobacteriota bacterium]
MFLLGNGDGPPQPGDSNLLEWYFPQRLVIDIFKAQLDSSGFSAQVRMAISARGGNPITLTENRRVNLPVLAIRAQQGILQSPVSFISGVAAFTLYL